MYLNPVSRSTSDAFVSVPFNNYPANRFPFLMVGSGLATAPKMGLVATLGDRSQLVTTFPRAHLASLGCCGGELCPTDQTCTGDLMRVAPPVSQVAIVRTEPCVIPACLDVERRSALFTRFIPAAARLWARLASQQGTAMHGVPHLPALSGTVATSSAVVNGAARFTSAVSRSLIHASILPHLCVNPEYVPMIERRTAQLPLGSAA